MISDMKPNDYITIIPSAALEALKLNELIGRKATLVEEGLTPRHLGWWVRLEGEPYLGEQEWFIPIMSIVR